MTRLRPFDFFQRTVCTFGQLRKPCHYYNHHRVQPVYTLQCSSLSPLYIYYCCPRNLLFGQPSFPENIIHIDIKGRPRARRCGAHPYYTFKAIIFSTLLKNDYPRLPNDNGPWRTPRGVCLFVETTAFCTLARFHFYNIIIPAGLFNVYFTDFVITWCEMHIYRGFAYIYKIECIGKLFGEKFSIPLFVKTDLLLILYIESSSKFTQKRIILFIRINSFY